MSKIFISYRGSDEGYQPEILKTTLSKYFNRKSIFYDFEDIQPGQDFELEINKAIETAEVMFVLIGKDWLNILNQRSEQSGNIDYVKYEIEKGLEKLNNDKKFQLFPVLFDGVRMPASVDLPESIKLLHKVDPITIEQGKLFEALDKLGLEVCRKVNSPTYCLIKMHKYRILSLILLTILGCIAYNYFDNKPECEGFSSNKDLNILMVPDEGIDFASLESIAFGGLDPYLPNLKPMKGDYYKLDMDELKKIAKPCSPSLMIKGNANNCCMATFDPAIEKYIIENYSIYPSQFSKCNTSLEKLACVINTFLSEKNNNNNVFSNPTCIQHQFNEIALKTEIKDTLDMMIGQSMANMYEKQGKLDSAMLILEKLSLSGGVNPDTVYTRMSRIASKTKNTAVEIIAKTGLIKQADKKGDNNTKEKLEKEVKVLNTKLNSDQAKVKPITSPSKTLIKQTTVSSPALQQKPTNTTPSSGEPTTNPSSSPKQTTATVTPINTTSNVKLYEKLNNLIVEGNYQQIDSVYKKYKEKIDNDPAMLSLYYESRYKAKKISDSIIPEQLLKLNQRMKTKVIIDKIKKGN